MDKYRNLSYDVLEEVSGGGLTSIGIQMTWKRV